MKRAIVFVNGNLSDLSQAKKIISKEDYLIAADGGVKHILKLGLIPQIAIGDLDSTPKNMKSATTKIIKYPREKDKTDFELVIDYCLEKKFKEIIIFGIFGDRIDHFIANILLLIKIQTENQSVKIKIIEGNKEMHILNKKIVIYGQIGDELSIIPINKLEGVTTEGLLYRLIDHTLPFGTTRGISNVLNETSSRIEINKGVALIIHLRKKYLRDNK